MYLGHKSFCLEIFPFPSQKYLHHFVPGLLFSLVAMHVNDLFIYKIRILQTFFSQPTNKLLTFSLMDGKMLKPGIFLSLHPIKKICSFCNSFLFFMLQPSNSSLKCTCQDHSEKRCSFLFHLFSNSQTQTDQLHGMFKI